MSEEGEEELADEVTGEEFRLSYLTKLCLSDKWNVANAAQVCAMLKDVSESKQFSTDEYAVSVNF